jgi:type IV secretion system protein VirD4
MGMVNMYMDLYKANKSNLTYKSKAEKYAKIISKTIISPGIKNEYGANSFFYDAAEGLLTSSILLVAEYCQNEYRHIVSVYKVIQDMMGSSEKKRVTEYSKLLKDLPDNHKAKWFAGAALNASDQGMASVMSTALSKLNAFLDTELEQIICFDSCIDTEKFCSEKTAIFIVLPEEDNTKHFMVSLIVQQMYREILTFADEQGGKLKKKVLFFLDEFGSIPKIESAEMMFSASRSRGIGIIAIIQSFAQLEKNYGREGCSVICDNAQLTIFGGLSPNSSDASKLSQSLGKETMQSGSVTVGNKLNSTNYSMIEHPLLSPVELKRLPKGEFIIMKSGSYAMKSKLKLYKDWGITFDCPFEIKRKPPRPVAYATKNILTTNMTQASNKPFLAEQLAQKNAK